MAWLLRESRSMQRKTLRIKVECLEALNKRKFRIRTIKKFCEEVLSAEGVKNGECGIIFVNNNYIKDINLSYFQKSRPTDVISFPLHEDNADFVEGEVYISVDQAAGQAAEYKVSVNNELQRLIVHGLLHVLGYD